MERPSTVARGKDINTARDDVTGKARVFLVGLGQLFHQCQSRFGSAIRAA
jgi:hypothetical protein